MVKQKYYSFVASYGSQVASNEEIENMATDLGFEDSIVDLSDFVPLAELVRSFNPMDAKVTPEFDYPNGEEPTTFEPPSEYDDVADVYVAVQEKSESLKRAIQERKASEKQTKQVPEVPEKQNADAPEEKLEKAKTAAAEK